MEIVEQAPRDKVEAINGRNFAFVDYGVFMYKSVEDIPPSFKSREYNLFKRKNLPDKQQVKSGMYYPIKPLDANNPEDRNVIQIKDKGLYVSVVIGNHDNELETRWVPYVESPKKGKRAEHRLT